MLNPTQYLQRYGIGIVCVGLTFGLMLALDPVVSFTKTPFLLFFGAVVISAFYGGRSSGIVTTLLCTVIAHYFFLDPRYTWTLHFDDLVRLALYIFQGVVLSWLIGSLRIAQAQLCKNFYQLKATEAQVQDLNQDLQQRVKELNQSNEKYRGLFTAIDEGFCICKLLFAEDGTPFDYRFLETNPAFETITGLKQAMGKTARELVPELEDVWIEFHTRVALTREPMRFEQYSAPLQCWFDVYSFPIGEPQSYLFGILFSNITDRKQTEERLRRAAELDGFRVSLSEALRPLADPVEIQATASRLLGEHLGANRVAYFEIRGADYFVGHDYVNGVEPLAGYYSIDSFGPKLLAAYRLGHAVCVSDVTADPHLLPAQQSAYAAIQIAAHIGIPLVKNGEFIAGVAVHTSAPRTWTPDEVSLTAEVAEYTWAAVERARAENALRESEENYRRLFTAIDEGFCIVEVLFDAQGMPCDHRILQANPAFERHSGLSNPHGKTASELIPGLEPYWNHLYTQVLNTGQSTRIEYHSQVLDRWLDVLVSPVDTGATHQVAIVFTDISERKASEIALRHSEARFRQIFECNMMPMGIWSLCGRILQANDAFLDLLGYTQEELETGQINWKTITPAEWVPVDERAIAELTTQGFCTPFEKEYFHKQGHRVPILLGAAPFQDNPDNGIFIAINLSERKKLEQALQASQSQLNSILNTAPASIARCRFFANRTYIVDYHSVGCEVVTGYQPEEITSELWSSRTFWEDWNRICEPVFDAVFQQQPITVEYRFRHKDGSIRWISDHLTSCRDEEQDCWIVTMVGIDITARKQAEAALRQSEERYRYLIESVPQLVWTADAQGHNNYISQQMCDYVGLPAHQLMNLEWQTVVHPDDVERIVQCWMESVQTGISYEAEYQLRRADGIYRWQLVRAIPFHNEQGEIVQWFGVSTDIHEKQELEQQRDQLLQQAQTAQEAAERANRIKDEFLAILSHELRAPLTPILGWAKLLQTRQFDVDKMTEALATIERNAKLQSQLIDDLLDVAKILRGKLSINVVPVDLRFVIEAAIDTVRAAAMTKNILLHPVLAQIGQVPGDASRLQQIVWNLLSNAIKFTPQNGRVEIRLESVEHQAQITVSDTGKGIKPDFLPHIFDSFRQEDVSITRQFGGLGLGLSIVKYLVDAHGGTITASSPGEGQGATFTVKLPLLQDERLLTTVLPSPAAIDLSGVKILAVDDSKDIRELLMALLTGYGAQVQVVASGEEVLVFLNHFAPDVLICDISMPEIDGYTLLKQIRALPVEYRGNIPAIALTAYAREEDYKRAFENGFQRYITKPLEPEQLVRAVVELAMK